jgi:transposase
MKAKVRFLGMDVHAETISVAVAEAGGELRSLGTIANRAESIRKLIRKLGSVEQLRACYEAGPTGYVLYWQLSELGVECAVIAPTLAPMKAGDRVKTDRRDAERLARSHRAGELTAVWVPDEASEALRDLVRGREAAKQDQLRARHRLSKFLLRQGRRPAAGVKAWTVAYMTWVRQLHFAQPAQDAVRLDYLHEVEHMSERIKRLEEAIREAVEQAPPQMQAVVQGLQALRGIALLSAVTIASEIGSVSRFRDARQLMSYSGTVPSENSSGKRVQRGGITKSGNAHLRRILGEAAWNYRRQPAVGPALRKRQEGVPEEIRQIAWKAQMRLSKRYARLAAAGKDQRKIVTAVGRELLGFVWAIGLRAEASVRPTIAA